MGPEREVLANIRAQSAGSHTVGDLDLPEELLRRIADRVLRASWQERYHRVAGDAWRGSPPARGGDRPNPPPFRDVGSAPSQPARSEGSYRSLLVDGRPVLRGFRLSPDGEVPVGMVADTDGPRSAAKSLVARDLERGLLATTADVLKVLGPERFAHAGQEELDSLAAIGLPVDWLAHFEPARSTEPPDDAPAPSRAIRVVRELASALAEDPGIDPEALTARFIFRFRASDPRFVAATESGAHEIGTVRLQLPRGDYWSAPADGGGVDIAMQLFSVLPSAQFLVTIERSFEPALQRTAAGWDLPLDSVRLLLEDHEVSQWAQDNGKAGEIISGGSRHPATLIPRYASRREDGSEVVPGDTLLMAHVARSGHPVVQSPLLFQGGDLLIAYDPARGERVAFLGEAELWRNWTLGLGGDQVLEAFRIELAVDRVVLLPSLSFHLDFDVSFREHGGQLLALVNDRDAAARIIVRTGLENLIVAGILDPSEGQALREALAGQQDRELLARLSNALSSRVPDPAAGFPYELARGFDHGDHAAAVADFQRFLLALDILAEPVLTEGEVQEDGHRGAYFRALRRHRRDSAEFRERLEQAGLRVIAIPGISEGSRSLCYLNGVQARKRYYMSAYGGAYAELDRAAMQALTAALGAGIEIVPIRTAESQRRMGGLHCSVAVHPPGAGRGSR